MLLFGFVIPVFGTLDPDKVDDLEKFTMDLFDTLSEDEKKQVMEEALKLEEYIKSLPEEEQKTLEQQLESEVQSLMDSGTLQEMTKEELITPPAKVVTKEEEQPKESKKDEDALKFAQDIPALKSLLKDISNIISNISLKLEAPGKLTKSDLEQKWKSIKNSLMESQSYILIISNNDKLMDSLLSSEYKQLKSQLESFSKDISKADKNFDAKIKDNALPVLDTLEKHIETNQLFWNIKRFMQKFAPEEVKKEEKKFTPPQQTTTPSIQTPSYPSYPSYHGSSYDKYPDRERRYTPPYIPSSRGGETGGFGGLAKPSSQESKSGPGRKAESEPGKDAKKTDSTKKSEPGKPKDDGKKPKDGDDKKKPKIVSIVQKEADELKKELKKITKEIEDSSLLKKFESVQQGIETRIKRTVSEVETAVENIPNELSKTVGELRENLIRMDALLGEPTKIAEEIDKKIAALPKQLQDFERKKIKEILEDKKAKFKEFGEALEKLSSEEIAKKAAQVRGAFQAEFEPVYEKLKNLHQKHKAIGEHVSGEFKKKEASAAHAPSTTGAQ